MRRFNVKILSLRDLATDKGIEMVDQKTIAAEASDRIAKKFNYNNEKIKENFDSLLVETELETYNVYLRYQQKYGTEVFKAFAERLVRDGEIKNVDQIGEVLGKYFKEMDAFFLSLSQSRKSRAGASFENIHNALFKKLRYPFDEQKVIDGKPDFILPSFKHFQKNPLDCIIFTAKRTLRERWRQIVTEGTRGLGFFLATIDPGISSNQLAEAHKNRIYIVVPEAIKNKYYVGQVNVLSFREFLKDYLDPALDRWKRNKVI